MAFGKLVKAIKVRESNRDRLMALLQIDPLMEDPDEALPIDWFVVLPFGEHGRSFYELLTPEVFQEMVDDTDKKALDNGFYEVRLR